MTRKAPNIVFVMADDMGYGDVGCYGATKIPTPHMDRLAEQGMRFTDAHSASAVCTPSRYAVLTGRYCWRSRLKRGVLWGHSPPLIEPDRPTVASMLQQAGFATAAVGKWHLGLGWTRTGDGPEGTDGTYDYTQPLTGGPNVLGFDYFFGISGSLDMRPYCFIENDRTVGTPTLEKDIYNPQQRPGLMVPGWRDDQVDVTFAAKAVKFMTDHAAAKPDQPFFLYLTPSAPHRPCVPPAEFLGRSQAGLRGDMVCVVDWVVGQVTEALEGLGLAEDTLLIVTSDNGARAACHNGLDYGHKSCGDWRGHKADIWDGGHREPFIVRWPGHVAAGTTCEETVCLGDLTATCADILGIAPDDEAAGDSFSFLPFLEGGEPTGPVREAIVHHSASGMFSIRRGPWKLILGLGSGGFTKPSNVDPQPGGPQGQLYNLDNDPAETTNLWPDTPEIVEELTAVLEGYQQAGRSRP